jgi:hypothetical protein
MARTASKRRRPPRQPQPLPPPLPPEERSVGQLVAETIRFYQHHFFQTLPLGLSVAALTQLAVAYGLGVLVFLPVPLLAQLLVLPAVAYLSLVGWVVPAALVESRGAADSFRRSYQLARVDFVHALGGLATLVIVFYVVRLMLALLLRTGSEVTERSAALLADLVLSPMLFVGSAILYLDQAARLRAKNSKLEAPTQEA